MDLATLMFRLKVKDAQILNSNMSSTNKEKEEFTDISFDFKSSVELFLLHNFYSMTCCISKRKEKKKIVDRIE